jgi:hypothetical protein
MRLISHSGGNVAAFSVIMTAGLALPAVAHNCHDSA